MIHIDFQVLISHAGSEEGARFLFQRLASSLVNLLHRDAREIRPAPGDWGIDIIVGQLTGVSLVWQTKYFIHGIGDSQKNQIRESFSQLMKKASENSFLVDAWTLCIPCSLSTEEMQWWEKWKTKKSREYSVRIELWDETKIRTLLESPDAQYLTLGYFGGNPTIANYFIQAMADDPERDIQTLPEPELFKESSFVKKLKLGGISELLSAKTQFFNAELLVQELLDKGDPIEITAVHSLQEKLRSIWETRYNEACTSAQSQLSGLYPSVMKAVEESDKGALASPIKASFVHKQGMLHQLANKCEVGWTKNFRDQFYEV